MSGSDCDRPIRCWLWVQMSLYFSHVAFIILAEAIPACGSYDLRKIVGETYLPANSVIEGCILIWVLLGNVWFYDCADKCKNGTVQPDFEEGFTMMVVILATYYSLVLIVGIAFLVVTILVCVGNAAANRAKYATLS